MLFPALTALLAIQAAEPAKPDCGDETQQGINRCATWRWRQADREMQARFEEVLDELETADREMRAEGYLGLSRPLILQEAQKSWLLFREQQCTLEGLEVAGGSMQPMVEAGCFARMARLRTKELRLGLFGE